ncbi:hypothetical protein IFM89_002226 [Coptis chinensis]|uniref:Uncharacterized protein n=1 Tax=Coptis chinensis TaxID=261450 RepID=A0A835IIR8_9MAGN|nr:hypothetical protein IFM89_002226 [Coptis chinensis]
MEWVMSDMRSGGKITMPLAKLRSGHTNGAALTPIHLLKLGMLMFGMREAGHTVLIHQRIWRSRGSLACLKTSGYMVSFRQASGLIDPVMLSALAAKSLFLIKPSLFHYIEARDELLKAAGELFTNVASGVLGVRVNHTYPLSQAAQSSCRS